MPRNYGSQRLDEEGGGPNDPLMSEEERIARNPLESSWLDAFETRKGRYTFFGLLAIGILVILSLLLTIFFRGLDPSGLLSANMHTTPLSSKTIHSGWLKCKEINDKQKKRSEYFKKNFPINPNASGKEVKPPQIRTNPRADPKAPVVVIRSVTIWDGVGNTYKSDILLKDGIIAKIEKYISIPKGAKIIQGHNKILTPGIVDMHSHIGVDSWPELEGSDDTNEMTRPAFPQLRTLDGFNPKDKAIAWARSGGVTTSLVLPGSGNLMGGEAFTFKLRTMGNLSVEASLVQAGVDEDNSDEFKWRYMKFACGENPKRVYGERGKTPSTRMGSAYLFREMFNKASQLVREQDEWCGYMENNFSEADVLDGKVNRIFEKFPESLALESLSQVIRGNVQPHIHCYETEDLEALVRISEEFQFQIWAFHHALEAYLVPDLIHRAGRDGFNVTVATFADGWGYKKEAYLGTLAAPHILAQHGIPVALKSDHPVINSQQLMYEATKAFNYGLNSSLALAALTSVPAKALGLSHRIGSIQVGMDADVVLWDSVPLTVGAHPSQVFIDGIPQIPELEDPYGSKDLPKYDAPIPMPVKRSVPECNTKGMHTFVLDGLSQVILANSSRFHVQGNGTMRVVVVDGKLACVGTDCHVSQQHVTYHLGGDAWLIPGLVGVSTKLGLNEIEQEDSTGDGYVEDVDINQSDSFPRAFDGLRFGGKHLKEAFEGGITTSISAPLDRAGVVAGYGVAFYTDGISVASSRDIVKEITSLHANIGGEYFTKDIKAVSSQISQLRRLLLGGLNSTSDAVLSKVLNGKLPLVVRAENADDILPVATFVF
ncbi:hypothetical protein DSO57_1027897 [Entomophthora muscae]|uniref:Uncharacterized protein n=1 Tax=Entomophthora muscae TaxID=34485 RepID=A0ACC2UME7_9FUNG|nr:hypothetical protein DSO57_1027897 [Entomophthora muscae]